MENKCRSIAGTFTCVKEFSHTGSHNAGCGVSWEDTKSLPVSQINHTIIVGKNSQSAYLLIEYVTADGRRFFKRDYQIYKKDDNLIVHNRYSLRSSGSNIDP